MHNLGTEISTSFGVEPFYNIDFPPPTGPTIGSGIVDVDGSDYYIYRRAWPTTASSLTYRIRTT